MSGFCMMIDNHKAENGIEKTVLMEGDRIIFNYANESVHFMRGRKRIKFNLSVHGIDLETGYTGQFVSSNPLFFGDLARLVAMTHGFIVKKISEGEFKFSLS